jgi:hypothetical protein
MTPTLTCHVNHHATKTTHSPAWGGTRPYGAVAFADAVADADAVAARCKGGNKRRFRHAARLSCLACLHSSPRHSQTRECFLHMRSAADTDPRRSFLNLSPGEAFRSSAGSQGIASMSGIDSRHQCPRWATTPHECNKAKALHGATAYNSEW